MNRKFFAALVLACTLLFAAALQAQKKDASSAAITGVVLGADGKPVPAAAVTCESSAGLKPRVVHTDAKGHYLITGLKQDAYDLRASTKSAYSDWEKNIPLR